MTRKTRALLNLSSIGAQMAMPKAKTHFEQVPLELVKKIAAEMVKKKNDTAAGKRPQRSNKRSNIRRSHGNTRNGD